MKIVLPASLESKCIFIDLQRATQKTKCERYRASNKTVQFTPGFYLFSLEYIFVVRIWAVSSEKLENTVYKSSGRKMRKEPGTA